MNSSFMRGPWTALMLFAAVAIAADARAQGAGDESAPEAGAGKPEPPPKDDKAPAGEEGAEPGAEGEEGSEPGAEGEEGAEPAEPTVPELAEALTGQAKTEYDSGKLLYTDGDYAGALLKFEAAHSASGDPRLLWNMAACEKNLRHYARMLVLVERYRDEGKDLLTDEDRRVAEALIDTVKDFVGSLKVQVEPEGSRILLNGELVGVSPLTTALRLDMGSRTLRVEKSGFDAHEQLINVEGGKALAVAVKLSPAVHEARLIVMAGKNATIRIDGNVVGTSRYESVLPSGSHTVRVTAPEMQAYQQELMLRDDEVRRLRITLEPVPSSSMPVWPWLVGGAAVAAGAVVAGIFIFQPEDTQAGPTSGTMDPGFVVVQ